MGESLGLSEQEIIEEPENPDEWTVYDADGEEIPGEGTTFSFTLPATDGIDS